VFVYHCTVIAVADRVIQEESEFGGQHCEPEYEGLYCEAELEAPYREQKMPKVFEDDKSNPFPFDQFIPVFKHNP
jgi:hypothetical protein